MPNDAIQRSKDIANRAIGKCTPNADRLANSTKLLIDKVMKGQIFENASALGALQWILCTQDLETLVKAIPPWAYNGVGEGATQEQQHFFQRLMAADPGGGLLAKLRTLQFGPESAPSTETFSDKLRNQATDATDFKSHTDKQSGVGDPSTLQSTMGIASAYDSARQQMEGTDQDNFTRFFNSTLQGPIILEQMNNLLCVPDSIGFALRQMLNLIASQVPFTLDDIAALLGGNIEEFFVKLDLILSQLAGFIEYLNFIVDTDLSQFNLAQAYVQRFTVGQFVASMVRGDGRGNCIMRAMLEEFTGSDNLRDAITAINIERDKEESAQEQTSESETESGKQRAYDSQITEKEMFFKPVEDDLVLAGFEFPTGPSSPPPIDAATALRIQSKLAELDQRTMMLGYGLSDLINAPAPTAPVDKMVDGGFFAENSTGGPDQIIPIDSQWYSSSTGPGIGEG